MKTTRDLTHCGSRNAGRARHWDLLEPMEGRLLLSTVAPAILSAVGTPPGVLLGTGTGGNVITPPPISPVVPVGLTIAATVGVPFDGDVGLIKGLTGVAVSQLSATINWGDSPIAVTPGSTAVTTITGTPPTGNTGTPASKIYFDSAGVLHIAGIHTYLKAGQFPVTINVIQSPPAGSLGPTRLYRIYSNAVVTEKTTGVVITPTVNQSFTGVVGNFTYVLPPVATPAVNPVATTLVAFINWGDGTLVSKGTITQTASGNYSVTGTHTYTAVSTFKITISVFAQSPWLPPFPIPVGGNTSSTTTDPSGPLPSTLCPPTRLIALIYSTANVQPAVTTTVV